MAVTRQLQRQVLNTFLKDVKASGTVGGTATSGAYQTRTLNTQEGDTSFCTLSSNQFTLSAGTYEIYASAPAGCDTGILLAHKAKIRNITDSSDTIVCSSEVADANTSGVVIQSRSIGLGTITLTASKTFELQHRVNTTFASTGFGRPSTFGENEVYSIVKISKLA